jgi:pimeloyl-ACP methyl ester carboxylesterase
VNVPFGQVHYRAAGYGPPVVLLHDSPRSSAMHEPLLAALADEFTAIAIDTPGYGRSTPLPPEPRPEIPDYAAALGAALTALGIERCALYGCHTSSKIALEFAAQAPERVALAVLDGLSLPPGPPDEAFIERYMSPFVPTADGGYLASQWTKIRDLHRFFPWFRRERAARLALDLPDDAHLHRYALDVLMAGAHYSAAYSAAMRYAAGAVVARLRSPTVFMARQNDVLFRYLDDLPAPLPTGCSVERLPVEPDTWRERLRALFRQHAGDLPAPPGAPDPLNDRSAASVASYVDRPGGQVHVRRYGRPGGPPPILVLHETPGGPSSVATLAAALATDRAAYVVDLPGLGGSDALPTPDAAGYTAALRDVLDALKLPLVDVVAEFTSTPLAIDLARQLPDRVRRLVLDGVFLLSAQERRELWRQYCPKLAPRWDGTHLHSLWQRLRDQELAWPWYARGKAAIRVCEPRLDAEHLHRQLLETLPQLDHYGDAANAALEYPVKDRLEEVHQPVLLPRADGDLRYQWTDKVRRRLDNAVVADRADDPRARADAFRAFFDAAD